VKDHLIAVPAAILEAVATRAAELVLSEIRDRPSPWMTRRGAASYLGLPVSRLEKDRRIPCHRDGRRVLYHRDELDAHFLRGSETTLAWSGDSCHTHGHTNSPRDADTSGGTAQEV
jgi:excisionase family DNA binding protein